MHASVHRYQGIGKARSEEITRKVGDSLLAPLSDLPGFGGSEPGRLFSVQSARRFLLAVLGAAALVVATLTFFPTRAPSTSNVALRTVDALEGPIVARVDEIRHDAGLPAVRYSGGLTDAAESHAARLVRTGTFAHRSPGEKPFSRRLQSFYSARGFSHWVTAENLYWKASTASPNQIVAAWMASPPHRVNILDPGWRDVGVAAVRVPGAPGVYGGQNVTIVVIEFGTRTR